MFGTVAKLVLVADIVFIFSYGAIIWKIIFNKPIATQREHKQHRGLTNTVTLCLGIVLVFVVFTTRYVAVYLTTWNRPAFLKELSMYLFLLNRCPTLLYILSKSTAAEDQSMSKKITHSKLVQTIQSYEDLSVTAVYFKNAALDKQ